jgi:hypothetical protein
VCIQLFRENFDADVPFNIRQSRKKCFDDILSRAPCKDYANRKIEDIKKNRQRLSKLTEPQKRKNKAFFLGKARASNLHLKRVKQIPLGIVCDLDVLYMCLFGNFSHLIAFGFFFSPHPCVYFLCIR